MQQMKKHCTSWQAQQQLISFFTGYNIQGIQNTKDLDILVDVIYPDHSTSDWPVFMQQMNNHCTSWQAQQQLMSFFTG